MNIRFIITGLLALLYAWQGAAQTPQYSFPNMPQDPDSFSAICPYSIGWRNDAGGDSLREWAKYQNIYRPFMFPGMPAGKVTSIYLRSRSRNFGADTSCIYDSFKVRMGYTEDTAYGTQNRTVEVPFITGLTTVFQTPSFRLAHPIVGTWIKIPLTTGSFSYDLRQNFVVELRGGARGKQNGIDFGVWAFNLPAERILVAADRKYDTLNATKSRISFPAVFAIGFDLIPVGVTEQSNIQGVGLFPNPAPHGRFNISLDAKQAMQAVRVTISDITGRQIQSRQFAHPGTHFFEEINLSSAAPGIYFVRIEADGTVMTRRVSVE